MSPSRAVAKMNSSSRTVLRGQHATNAVSFPQEILTETTPSAPAPVATPAGTATRIHFDEVYAEQMAALRERSAREGFEVGHAEGMQAAEEAIAAIEAQAHTRLQAAHDAWTSQAQSALSALTVAAERLDARVAPDLSELTGSLTEAAYTLVADLLGRELATATDPGRDAVDRALRLLPVDAPTVVRIHPTDHAVLDPDWVAGLPATVILVADASVEPAGALAESGARRVDAQVSTALLRVREVLGA